MVFVLTMPPSLENIHYYYYFEQRVSNFNFIIMIPSHLYGTVTDSRKLILSKS